MSLFNNKCENQAPTFDCSSLNTKKEGTQNHVDFKRPANSFT